MAERSATPLAPALIEQPTQAARLRISVEPWVKITTPWCGSPEGTVPPSEVHHLAPHLVALAIIELVLAAAVAALIAACGHRRN